uniref:RNA-directed DNA polymerase n=1 Tax=Mus spicilegus TaxID=10103 RepID=A0A8C6GB81_MUSSI
MNSELFSWGTGVPVSTALQGKSGLELSNEIQDSLSEVKWEMALQGMFGLELFLVLGAFLFLFTCYIVVKAGLKILDEIRGNLSEVKRGERVGAKRKYGTQTKYTGLSKGLEPEEKLRLGRNTWREIRRKRGKREKKKDQLAEVSKRRNLYSSLDKLKEPALGSYESDDEFSSEETDWEEEAAHYQPDKVLANQLRKKPKAAGESQFAAWPPGSRLQGTLPPYAEPPPCVVRQPCAERQCAERQCADSFIPREEQRKIQQAFPVFEGAKGGRVHAPVEYVQIKELAESVRKYGTNANFTLVQLDRLAGMALTPADWQMIIKAALPSLQKAYPFLLKTLSQWGLQIATEKVQISDTGQFLGSVVSPDKIVPQKVEIRRDHLHTLNDFQKLLGDINWLRAFLKIPSAELRPLFGILEGDPHISSPRALTLAANQALQKVENALQNAQLQRIEDSQPFSLCVFKTAQLPTAVLWQNGPLLWIHPNVSPAKIIDWYPDAIAQLALKGLKAAITHFGRSPYLLIVPYTAAQVQTLAATSNDWAVLVTSFSGQIDNHYPKHPILQFAQNQSVVFPQITVRNPLKNGIVVYTDGSKTGIGAYVANGKVVSKQYNENSPQVVECLVVLEVLKTFLEPLNIVSDSCYVVNAVNLLEVAGVIKPSSRVANIFQQIQLVLLSRRFPAYITHVRAHSGLPGPMALKNDLADKATKVVAAALSSPVEAARNFHNNFHVTAETLRSRFSLTRKEARDIVTQCQSCCEFLPVPHVRINPRGIRPLQVWQMDVTHVSSFGKLQYLHVSIDTCSGIMFASPLTGKKASHVIQHCLEAWSAWGKPKLLKTDNGPAYTSQKFQQFCRQMDVTHLTGLPYNPQGQGIVERAHRTLKSYLLKQKRGIEETLPRVPRVSVSMALFTLNFLNIDAHGHTAAERHCSEPDRPNEMVKWKNVLDNKWYGPDPILIRSRGAVCVFPQNEDNPFWIPERLTRKIQ